jgi:hypothetical protein
MMKSKKTTLYSCAHDTSPSLIVHEILTTQSQVQEDQRCNIFQTQYGIDGHSIKVIIDGGSCQNLASTKLCDNMKLHLSKHPNLYKVQWLSNEESVQIM